MKDRDEPVKDLTGPSFPTEDVSAHVDNKTSSLWRQAVKQASRRTGRYTNRSSDRPADRHKKKRQIDRQIDKYTYRAVVLSECVRTYILACINTSYTHKHTHIETHTHSRALAYTNNQTKPLGVEHMVIL